MTALAKRIGAAGWAVAVLCAAVVFAWLLVVPLDVVPQAVFGVLIVAAGLLTTRSRSRYATILICTLSLFASTRYMVWRFSGSMGLRSPGEWLLGGALLAAECYTWLVMVLSFVQSARPLRRPVALLSMATDCLPTVDVYVPTYNEPLSVVGPSVIAAMAMDYPADRFRVHLLDDGNRPEFADFARRVGCEYIARADNTHAKAGNLNAAMKVTDGDLICVLDCDHVATRAFLQLTVGWFEKDPRLAVVQTPHFFYSQDPIQRNIKAAEDLPGEGDLFYDTIQSGNDLWNATFFCGSCAVIRRAALEEVGGFAYETVTEDAHTALRIQRCGWNTAFLNIRLSAGLATETLNQHVAQRVRWCRGMTQILRTDNPLFGPGLKLPQRLCYLNALLYYQFPLVRVIFLVSPLAYLFFGLNLMHAPAGVVSVYAIPHLLQGMIANQRLQGRQRRLFWGEIYETILAFHLVRPALFSLIWPKAGKFKVTDKGLKLETGYFDKDLVRPHLITAGLLCLGLAFGYARLFWPSLFHESLSTLLLSTAWTIFNLLILLSAVAVAREGRQVRGHVRRPARMPVTLYFADGRVVDAVTSNVSTGGLAIVLPTGFDAEGREVTDVDLQIAGGRTAFPVEGVALRDGELRVKFVDVDDARERRLIQALMARADLWQPEPDRRISGGWVRAVTSLLEISSSTLRFISRQAWTGAKSRLRPGAAAVGALALLASLQPGAKAHATAAVSDRVLSLNSTPAPLRCVGGKTTGRLVLASDQVVLAARLELTRAAAGEVVTVNGQTVARLGAAGRMEVEPAVFLPGANEIVVASPRGVCAQLAASDVRIVLTTTPLALARAAPVAS
ncbi:MAG TPA: UDP-forming cellulose synthase catalytic subunit, partial [Phenylobacterium sp.]|uniref:UDP-forming cellulose synthase catalytic subunit n=1 Tax=Phenylobacterium sp. TaxID=1871053 RepID=UPI002B47D0D2